MEIEVNRIYSNNLKEHPDATRRKRIYYSSIESIEEEEDGHTEITLSWGEKMVIDMSYDAFEIKLETIKQELEDEARNRDILGD